MKLTFDDVLIEPAFSTINSRSEVDIRVEIPGIGKFLPIVSANMDSVTGVEMAIALNKLGAIGCLHRFMSHEDNVNAFSQVDRAGSRVCAVSFGLGHEELSRAIALHQSYARLFVLDVAHAAQSQVVEQYRKAKEVLYNSFIIVGNFASATSVNVFCDELGFTPDGIKIGIGPGSACTTRIKTGVGYPQLSAIQDIVKRLKNRKKITEIGAGFSTYHSLPMPLIIADGGLRTPGDIAKALGAGADLVMIGGILAGTDETPGEVVDKDGIFGHPAQTQFGIKLFKQYRGSASKESYDAQGKIQSYITSEGEAFTVPYKGSVKNVIQDIEGGLRSAFTYVGARNLKEFHQKVNFVQVSSASIKENGAHGKS